MNPTAAEFVPSGNFPSSFENWCFLVSLSTFHPLTNSQLCPIILRRVSHISLALQCDEAGHKTSSCVNLLEGGFAMTPLAIHQEALLKEAQAVPKAGTDNTLPLST